MVEPNGLGVSIHDAMVVNVDNQVAIALAKNPVFHDRSKHIDIQYHYTRSLVKAGEIGLFHKPMWSTATPVLKQIPLVYYERESRYLATRTY